MLRASSCAVLPAAARALASAAGGAWRGGASAAPLAASASPLEQRDSIALRGLVFHGHHGCLKEENALGQKFVVDATLWADLAAAGRSDQLQDTLDYAAVYNEIRRVVEGPPRALQEAVAEEAAAALLALDRRVAAVRVYIRKPHVALPGVLESVGVDIFRRRAGD
ncbi:FOLB1 [Scenedesmus sp. PABB004]|nr:FOLB1 [Scenedesmus sp. PABB004]